MKPEKLAIILLLILSLSRFHIFHRPRWKQHEIILGDNEEGQRSINSTDCHFCSGTLSSELESFCPGHRCNPVCISENLRMLKDICSSRVFRTKSRYRHFRRWIYWSCPVDSRTLHPQRSEPHILIYTSAVKPLKTFMMPILHTIPSIWYRNPHLWQSALVPVYMGPKRRFNLAIRKLNTKICYILKTHTCHYNTVLLRLAINMIYHVSHV